MKRTALTAALLLTAAASAQRKPEYTGWSDYGGTADSAQYSALKQINKSNVARLELAWFYSAPGPSGRFAFNPLIVDGVMYVGGENQTIVALDGATGKRIWTHPLDGTPTYRGLNYWSSKDGKDRRLIFAVDSYLQQINASTGVTINTFGNDGRVNLREGLGRDPKMLGQVQSGTPGRVFENLVIVGTAPGEMFGSAPGDIRAYDVLKGKLMWQFHTIPHPGEFGYDTWPPEAYKYVGGVNTWGEITLDETRGIAYFPLGSPTYDFYGGDRHGANLFGNSIVALDARTGKRLWHFQTVHHDLWDYDLTTAPKLLTVKHNGKNLDIVAQPTKFGFIYAFNRVTGEPLWPIEERAVPKSDTPGEHSYPTQPFPTRPAPFARQKFTVDDINPHLDPAEKEKFRQMLLAARNEGMFTPPSVTHDTVVVPGDSGGANWGSTAVDPKNGMLYIKVHNAPNLQRLSERTPGRGFTGGTPPQQGRGLYGERCQPCHGPDRTGGIKAPKEIGMERFKTVLAKGQAQMPPFPDLTEAQITNLAAFLDNPDAGAPPAGRGVRPPMPPPPPGQVRFFGRFNNQLFASNGLPVFSPPWTTLTAVDMNDGAIKWSVPLATSTLLAERGVTGTGAPRGTAGGPVATEGGLIFVGSAPERVLLAYDKDNGKLLWEHKLVAGPRGIPSVYEAGGHQYIAFLATVGGGPAAASARPEAQGYYVFSLPRNSPKKKQ